MYKKSDLKIAADNIISNCLKVSDNEEVAIIFEKNWQNIAEQLNYSILHKKAFPINLMVFKDQQCKNLLKESNRELTIPESVHELLDRVAVIITLIQNRVDELKFRRQILKHVKNNVCRIAHMPGLTAEQFSNFLTTDFEKIKRIGKILSSILERNIGKEIRITTKAGTDLKLTVSEVIRLSSGIVDKPGQLGNLPGGEVFFAPLTGSASGIIVIDISLPNNLIKNKDDEIKFEIENGRIKPNTIVDPNNLITKHLKNNGADVLCEIGIGLNDKIKKATGSVIIDEKMGKTVHIALGDNTFFGGDNSAPIHIDMVMKRPNIYINSDYIMKNGDLNIVS